MVEKGFRGHKLIERQCLGQCDLGRCWRQGTILTSSDGTTWTPRISGTKAYLNSMVFAANLFVIVGESGTILTSANGTTWTRRNSGTTDYLYDVSYGSGKFVAVSDTSTVLTSANGVTWAKKIDAPARTYGVAYGNGKFVSVGGGRTCHLDFCWLDHVTAESSDAVTWTQSITSFSYVLSDLVFGNGTFVAVGGSIQTSLDGITWIPQSSGTGAFFYNIAFGDGIFTAVGAQQGVIVTSTNGSTWTSA